MTVEKPGRPKPWRVNNAKDGACAWIQTGAGAFVVWQWNDAVWDALADCQRDEDAVLALERASAINHQTEWFDHYGNPHAGMQNILRDPLGPWPERAAP